MGQKTGLRRWSAFLMLLSAVVRTAYYMISENGDNAWIHLFLPLVSCAVFAALVVRGGRYFRYSYLPVWTGCLFFILKALGFQRLHAVLCVLLYLTVAVLYYLTATGAVRSQAPMALVFLLAFLTHAGMDAAEILSAGFAVSWVSYLPEASVLLIMAALFLGVLTVETEEMTGEKRKNHWLYGLFWMVPVVLLLFLLMVNQHVKSRGYGHMVSAEEAVLKKADCIVILGAGLNRDAEPSLILIERLERGMELYRRGAAPKILMSGDHGREDYDEVYAMKQYAIDQGVPSEDIFMDHAGFSTYESIYRAKEIFGISRAVIVTQKYHLSRALYIAERLGMEACGVPSDRYALNGWAKRQIREVFARGKDYMMTLFKPEPTYLGEAISIEASGDVTNDKAFR